ncbi:hypothetical protein ACLB2K_055010 [Fragaria x ananassa]
MASSSTSQPPQQVSIMPVQLSEWNNYFLWKSFIIPVLKSHDILDLAEGRELCPPQFLSSSEDIKENKKVENPAYIHWTRKDQLLLRHAVGCTSGRALWFIFEDLFAQKAKTQLKQLKDCLENLMLTKADPSSSITDSDMSKYVSEATDIFNGLHAAGFRVEDREVVSRVLGGLPSECDEREELYDLLLHHRFPKSTADKIKSGICIVLAVLLLGVLESDCPNLVKATQSDVEDSAFGMIVEDIKQDLLESNLVAHKLARLALSCSSPSHWVGAPPGELQGLLASPPCNR